MPGKVPERWESYTPYGDQVMGTRFMAFKVPLEEVLGGLLDHVGVPKILVLCGPTAEGAETKN